MCKDLLKIDRKFDKADCRNSYDILLKIIRHIRCHIRNLLCFKFSCRLNLLISDLELIFFVDTL